ncbi:sensor domain-containing diguanylate cyclase [Vibrio aestuarianus]|uniref:sensor domain-containing diguanylate cyclase n=1 Tax=Vibrio aestuarianus TaxID=28171 RepID=UPI00237C601F|nr:sensor domain-containing diguanylate cyclase [Vibrio aestuarianus]MDE1339504.1 GGDEF domain-containing protein [Vibrio aestuarianus]
MDSVESESKCLNIILNAVPDHVFIFSESGEYLNVFGGEDNNLGFDCKSFIGKTLYEVMPHTMAHQCHQFIKKALEGESSLVIEYSFNEENMITLPEDVTISDEVWFQGIIKPLPMVCLKSNQRTVLWTARNITHRYNLEKQLKTLSEIDELTGLLNRRAFMKLLSQDIENHPATNSNTSLLMLDIDLFKEINDHLGHLAGDYVIKHITTICSEMILDPHYIGRIGGEEFAIVLTETSECHAYDIAEKLRIAIQNAPCEVESYIVNVTVSIGVSQLFESDNSSKHILSRTDRAMYYSKQHGRNRVTIFDDKVANHAKNKSAPKQINYRAAT